MQSINSPVDDLNVVRDNSRDNVGDIAVACGWQLMVKNEAAGVGEDRRVAGYLRPASRLQYTS